MKEQCGENSSPSWAEINAQIEKSQRPSIFENSCMLIMPKDRVMPENQQEREQKVAEPV